MNPDLRGGRRCERALWRKAVSGHRDAESVVRRHMGSVTALAVACVSLPCWPQTYPVKTIRLICPTPPGGGADAAARITAQALSDQLGQQVVVDNRGGASGRIGTELVARATPDGYTLLLGVNVSITILPAAISRLPYDVQKDFAAISRVATSDYVLTVHPSLPAKSLTDLIALARNRPGELTYGSSGHLSGPHPSGALLDVLAKVKMMHVAYKGNGPAAIGVMSGETTMLFGSSAAVVPHVQSGKLVALATTGSKRTMPKLPAIAELLPGYEVSQWYGILAPSALPRDILDRLHAATVRAIATPQVTHLFTNLGTLPGTDSPDEFREFMRAETAKWARVFRSAGIKTE